MVRELALSAAMAVSACGSSDAPSGATSGPKRWSSVADRLDRVPLCAWGSGANDAFIGGGGLASGKGTLLLHWNGVALDEVATGEADTIWWMHGLAADDVEAVGEHGLVLRYDGTSWTRRAAPTTATLYGVWRSEDGEEWLVGGDLGAGEKDVIVHDGAKLAPPKAYGGALFKVWGASASDVHIVGKDGVLLHWDGASLTDVSLPEVHASIFTVHGRAGRVLAIGGPPATLLSWDGAAWHVAQVVPPEMTGAMTGLFLDASGTTFLVGEKHQRYEVDSTGTFTDDGDAPPASGDLHAVWGDGEGGALAVGGNYAALAQSGVAPIGVVARYGD